VFLQKELKDIERDKESGVHVEIIGDSIRHLTGYVQGMPSLSFLTNDP
jgi:hypothetical protein